MNSICVYCDLANGSDEVYAALAELLGKEFLSRNQKLVYDRGSN